MRFFQGLVQKKHRPAREPGQKYPVKQWLPDAVSAALAGMMLIIGHIWPNLAWLFYPGLIVSGIILLLRPVRRITAYAWVLPYFVVLGLSVWQAVFPWITGILLALLLAELCGRLLYLALRRTETSSWRLLVLPGSLFLFDFVFRHVPLLNRMNMIPLLTPVYRARLILDLAAVMGSSGAIWLLSLAAMLLILLLCPLLASMPFRLKRDARILAAPEPNDKSGRAADKTTSHDSASEAAAVLVRSRSWLSRGRLIVACLMISGLAAFASLAGNSSWIEQPNPDAGNGSGSSGDSLRVAVIHGQYLSSEPVQNTDDLIALHDARLAFSMDQASQVQADIYVFPEVAYGIWDRHNLADHDDRDRFLQAAEKLDATLLVCLTEGDSITKSKEDRFFSALLVSQGRFAGLTRKRQLVPFSETSRYSAGRSYEVFTVASVRVGVSICYDMQGPTVERLKANGAMLILAPFNDRGFSRIWQRVHRADAVLRAAECAIPVAMANAEGISQIIDARGHILGEIVDRDAGAIAAALPSISRISLYLLAGQYLVWILAFLHAGLILYLSIKKRNPR